MVPHREESEAWVIGIVETHESTIKVVPICGSSLSCFEWRLYWYVCSKNSVRFRVIQEFSIVSWFPAWNWWPASAGEAHLTAQKTPRVASGIPNVVFHAYAVCWRQAVATRLHENMRLWQSPWKMYKNKIPICMALKIVWDPARLATTCCISSTAWTQSFRPPYLDGWRSRSKEIFKPWREWIMRVCRGRPCLRVDAMDMASRRTCMIGMKENNSNQNNPEANESIHDYIMLHKWIDAQDEEINESVPTTKPDKIHIAFRFAGFMTITGFVKSALSTCECEAEGCVAAQWSLQGSDSSWIWWLAFGNRPLIDDVFHSGTFEPTKFRRLATSVEAQPDKQILYRVAKLPNICQLWSDLHTPSCKKQPNCTLQRYSQRHLYTNQFTNKNPRADLHVAAMAFQSSTVLSSLTHLTQHQPRPPAGSPAEHHRGGGTPAARDQPPGEQPGPAAKEVGRNTSWAGELETWGQKALETTNRYKKKRATNLETLWLLFFMVDLYICKAHVSWNDLILVHYETCHPETEPTWSRSPTI